MDSPPISISRLFEDRAGTLWVGTEGGGLSSFRDGRFTLYTVAAGLPSDVVRGLAEDDRGLVVGTRAGMARVEGGRVQPYDGPAEMVRAEIFSMASSRVDGSLWVAVNRTGSYPGGLYRVDASGAVRFGPEQGLTRGYVESLNVADDGTVWVGTANAGLFRYSGGRFENYSMAAGLPGDRVPGMAQGADKAVWIGTNGGLVRLKEPRLTVYTAREGLADDRPADIYQDGEGSTWIGSRSGLSRYRNGAFRVFTTKDGLPDNAIRTIARDPTGLIWVVTRAGAARWQNGRFVKSPDLPELPWADVNSLIQDRSGALWLALSERGVMRVHDGRITRVTAKDGLADDSALTLFEDRSGSIWVGTMRGGVTRMSGSQLTSWSEREGLANNHVKSFHQDSSGVLWIGTHGGGLSRFKDGTLANVSVRQGLYNDVAFQILEDDDGNLWMNCNKGIWRSSLKDLNAVADRSQASVASFSYGTADGMLSSEGTGANHAGAKMRDGSLWFATTKGVVVIDPRTRDSEPPRVWIEGITVDRQAKPADRPLRLDPSQQSLEIQYTALNWNRARDIKFKYRMLGFDSDWVDAGERRTAYYTQMPPGSYTFTVIADNGEGVWNTTGQSLATVVLPPFYRTWWFRSAAVMLVAGLVGLAWRRRSEQMLRVHAAQQAFSRQLIESQEHERRRIAVELHDSLGQHLLIIKNRAAIGEDVTSSDSPARTQFDEITVSAALALEEVRQIAHDLRPVHLETLGLTAVLEDMVGRVGGSAGLAVTADIESLDAAVGRDAAITLYRVVQECVSNVVRHANANRITVEAWVEDRAAHVTVRDDGIGFAADEVRDRRAGRKGLGLTTIAERVQMLGGTHTIASALGQGTMVTIRIPGQSEPS